MEENKYLQYNSKIYILEGKLVLVGGRLNKKIIANDIVLEVIKCTSCVISEKELVEHVKKKHSISTEKVLEILSDLVDKGFLIKNYIELSHKKNDFDYKKIKYMGIITCERPEALKNALGSYIENAQSNVHEMKYIVIDDSLEKKQYKNISIVKNIAEKKVCKIGYMGLKERKKLIDLIWKYTEISRELIEFGFLPNMNPKWRNINFTAGATRNCMNAVATTDKYLIIDDDSLPIGNYNTSERKIAFSQGQGRSKNCYYTEQKLNNKDIDIIALNELYLGKKLEQVISKIQKVNINDYANNSKILLEQQDIYKEAYIAMTTNTIQGIRDISVDTLLFSTHEKNLNWYVEKSEADYICSKPFLLTTTVTGIDPLHFQLPFIPVYRNEDVMTGMICNFLDEFMLGANVNSNLTHDKIGGYVAIKNSNSNFFEEILYPILLNTILSGIKINIPNMILPFQKKIEIFREYIIYVCGRDSHEMINNLTTINPFMIEMCLAKIEDKNRKVKEGCKVKYLDTYPNSIQEITESVKLKEFRTMILNYVELLKVWKILLQACDEIKNKEEFPITVF